MTKFTDGPAFGWILCLRRAPVFLRVVVDQDGNLDALDQLSDRPRLDEAIHCYERIGKATKIHILATDRRTGRQTGGFFQMASYGLAETKPGDDTMRSQQKWQQWCLIRRCGEMAQLSEQKKVV